MCVERVVEGSSRSDIRHGTALERGVFTDLIVLTESLIVPTKGLIVLTKGLIVPTTRPQCPYEETPVSLRRDRTGFPFLFDSHSRSLTLHLSAVILSSPKV